MSLQPLLVLLLVIKFGCMVNMGNSSSSNTRSSREDYNNTNTDSIFNDTSISDVSIACIKSHLNSGIPAKEFMRLELEAPNLSSGITEAHRSCNKDKNRYVNILPCDSTRVRLAAVAGVEGSDYINANFIAGDDTDRAYIATQGPLMHTRGDFWRMVWENNTTIVVMLGKERENERVKVDRYWPEEGEDEGEGEGDRGLQFQQLRVTLLDKRYDDDKHIAVRRLCLSLLPDDGNTNHNPIYNNNNNNNSNYPSHNQHNHHHHQQRQPICSRQVLHYQYEGWPDHGVPPSAAPIRKLVHMIEHERTQMQIPHPSPIVVHCSAGVGRTGTFVTIHMTLLRLFHALRDSGNNPFQNLNHSTNSLHGSTQSLNSSASSLHESTNSLHSSSGSLYGSTSSLNSLNGSSNSVHGQSNHSTATNIALTAKFNLYDTVLKLRKQRPGMVQQQEQYVFCYEAVAEEAEHLGLIPADPPSSSSSSSRRAPRTLSISTSSLPTPSPESTTTLRTSSSSYISSPTSVPPSPTFLDSSYFLNSSTSSLPSPPASPYIYPSLDCNTPSLFPPPGHTSPPHISSHSPSHPSHPSPSHPSHPSHSHSSHDPSCMFPLPHEPLTPPVDCQK